MRPYGGDFYIVRYRADTQGCSGYVNVGSAIGWPAFRPEKLEFILVKQQEDMLPAVYGLFFQNDGRFLRKTGKNLLCRFLGSQQ